MAPGGELSDAGPLTSVLLTDGGCGYAALGRIEPTLEITGSGSGAVFTPTLTPITGTCSLSVWEIDSVAVSGDGSGYSDGEKLKVTMTGGSIRVSEAILQLTTTFTRGEPEVAAAVLSTTGSGAVLAVTLEKNQGTPDTWGVKSVAVLSPGSGYSSGDTVQFTTTDFTVASASAGITLEPSAGPTYLTDQYSPGGGVGASLTVTFADSGNGLWNVATYSVGSGGAGYSVDDMLFLYQLGDIVDGEQTYLFVVFFVTDVDANGAVTAVSLSQDDGLVGSTGGVGAVIVNEYYRGQYYAIAKQGIPVSVTVTDGGMFYKESKDEPAIPADVTVTVAQEQSSTASGAVIEATIDTDPNSDTFGEITGLTIEEGGSGYLAWMNAGDQSHLNDVPFVLSAVNPKKLVTVDITSCYGSGGCVKIVPLGERLEPTLRLTTGAEVHQTVLAQQTGEDGLPYWTVVSVTPVGGTGQVDFSFGCATVEVMPNISFYGQDGQFTGADVIDGGKFYIQLDYDGAPAPLKKVEVFSAGSGYARLGREEPQWTRTQSGWTFTPTFAAPESDDCGLPYYAVESFAISGSGTPMANGVALNLMGVVTQEEKSDEHAIAKVYTREQPTVTATASSPGSGASLSVVLEETGSVPRAWRVASVSGGGGAGYQNGAAVTFSVPARVGEFGHYTIAPAAASCIVDADGAITSVSVQSGGSYYLDNGTPQEVVVESGGRYYRENPALEPYVSQPVVTVTQIPPSVGSGAEVSVTVDDDTSSPTFGRIVEATLDEPGQSYTLLGSPLDCAYRGGCKSVCGIEQPYTYLRLNGHGEPPEIEFNNPYSRNSELPLVNARIVFRSDYPLEDCNDFPPSATVLHGAPAGAATITPGGLWDSRGVTGCQRFSCYQFYDAGCESTPGEVVCPEQGGWTKRQAAASTCFICDRTIDVTDCAECAETFQCINMFTNATRTVAACSECNQETEACTQIIQADCNPLP